MDTTSRNIALMIGVVAMMALFGIGIVGLNRSAGIPNTGAGSPSSSDSSMSQQEQQ